MISCLRLFTALVLLATLVACAPAPTATPVVTHDAQLSVAVSILPQQYFVERIGGEHVQVNVMVQPGESPATYEPKPEQLKSLASAAAYFSIGVAFEDTWLPRIAAANAEMEIVDTAQGIERQPLAEHHHEGEDHADEDAEDHATAAPDPHIWTSPRLVEVQARTIQVTLSRLDPAHAADYETNLDAFLADIDLLDQEIRTTLAGTEGAKFMVFHPSWGYFAAEYGLEQIPVEVGGQEPSAQELAMLIEEAHEEGIQVVFAQPEFSTRAAETIAQEIGGQVLLISPLAPDWLDNMRQVAAAFGKALTR